MVSLRAIPMARMVIPLAIGILVADTFPTFPWGGAVYVLPFLLVVLYLLSLNTEGITSRLPQVFGAVLFLFMFILGAWLLTRSDEQRQSDYIGHFQNIQSLHGIVIEPPVEGKWWKLTLKIEAVRTDLDTNWIAASGNILVMLDSAALPKETVQYGTSLVFNGNPKATQAPKNPHQFDYQKYLHHKNIHHQIFAHEVPIIIAQNEGNPIWQYIYSLRKNLLQTLKTHLKKEGSYAVGAAVLLGHKNELSDDLRQTFVETGTMHILAVSGAHVGILFACLSFFLGFVPLYGRTWQIVEPILLAFGIWFFVLLTGAAEPATRAAIMFSFVLLAKVLRKDRNLYNILGLSALIMLLYEPRQLMTIGFQLSFGAVLGIALFWQHFRRFIPWYWNKWIRSFFDLVTLGCAAQLGILPLTLYYFHQLPTFFWLTGTLAMLPATVYLWGSIGLLTIGKIHAGLAWAIGVCLDWALFLMNKMLAFFQQLPGHLIGGIWLNGVTLALLSVALYAFAYSLHTKEKKAIWLTMGAVFMVGLSNSYIFLSHFNQEKIVVYSMGKNLLVDGFSGTSCLELSEGLDGHQVLFAAKSNRASHAIRSVFTPFEGNDKENHFFFEKGLMAAGNRSLLILDAALKKKNNAPEELTLNVDALLWRQQKADGFENQMKIVNTSTIILPNSIWRSEKQQLRDKAEKLGLAVWDLQEQGAWETEG